MIMLQTYSEFDDFLTARNHKGAKLINFQYSPIGIEHTIMKIIYLKLLVLKSQWIKQINGLKLSISEILR